MAYLNLITCINFTADVWGTVSDWSMVIVTFITGFLVFLTLKSQMAVQKFQSEALLLDRKRFKREIKPSLISKLEDWKIDQDGNDYHITVTISIKNNSDYLIDGLKLSFLDNNGVDPYNWKSNSPFFSIELPLPTELEPKLYSEVTLTSIAKGFEPHDPEFNFTTYLSINATYRDHEDMGSYSQKITLAAFNKEIAPTLTCHPAIEVEEGRPERKFIFFNN